MSKISLVLYLELQQIRYTTYPNIKTTKLSQTLALKIFGANHNKVAKNNNDSKIIKIIKN